MPVIGTSSSQAMPESEASISQAKRRRKASSSKAKPRRRALSNKATPARGAPSKQTRALKDGQIPTPTADCAHLLNPKSSDNSDQESRNNFGAKKPEEAGTSDSQLLEVDQICLGHSQPPWASMPFDIDTVLEEYALPGDDDTQSFDKYLYPGCLD
ncbi:leucine-twenty homeobox [Mus pahari]|uniref:leucine-twenty homeobox n=1 Tax=Mus pahari TaxID=10093 RepID=UPI000A310B2E|nr:leucine-twenty homeobox [Mus pahari]